MVFFSIVESSLFRQLKDRYERMDGEIYTCMCGSPVQKLKVILSHLHRLVQSAVSLNFRSSFLSPQESQLRVHRYFFTVKQLVFHYQFEQRTQHDLSPFAFFLLCSKVSAARRALSLSFLGSSMTSCSCASLRALLELVWVSMGNKTCSLKR